MALNGIHKQPHDYVRCGALCRRLGLLTAAATLIAAAPAHAAPQWLAAQTVSPPGQDTRAQQVAFDPGGDAVVVWQGAGSSDAILAAARPAGGVFSAPQTLSDPGADSAHPDIATDVQGNAIAVWLHHEGSVERVQAAYRPANGQFGDPQTLSEAGSEASEPRVAMDATGDAIVVWSLSVGGKSEIQAAAAAPGGVFGAPTDLTGLTTSASVPQVALDTHGDALAVWDGWDGSNIRIEDAVRPAGTGFGAAQFLSPPGYNADTPQVAFDAGGDALAVWRFDGPPASTVQAAFRPADGAFASVQTVSASTSLPAQAPQVAFDGDGEGVVVWQQSDGSDLRVDASARTPGTAGAFSAPSTLDPGGQEAYEPRIAGDGLSGTIASWQTFDGMSYTAQAVVRPAGGSFAPARTISATGAQESAPAVGVDAQGNAIAVWSRFSGSNYLVEAAGYDGAGPQPRGLTLPTEGIVGQPLQFFLAPLDVWSPVLSEGFTFGDGTGASGTNPTHTYTSPGNYQVSAITTDVLGNVSTVAGTVTIAPLTPPSNHPAVPVKRGRRHHHKRRRRGHGRHHHKRHVRGGRTHGRQRS